MSDPQAFGRIRTQVVAFTPTYWPADRQLPPFPPIIGTGMIVKEDGVVVTNHHVVDAFKMVYRPEDIPANDLCVTALYLHVLDGEQFEVPLEIVGIRVISTFDGGEPYYGPEKPDIALVFLKTRGLPPVHLGSTEYLTEGLDIAVCGYPMGQSMLTAPGWLHQLGPAFDRGIVSSVLPCPGVTPHGFLISIMSQGGLSGSPVFSPSDASVLGVLSSRLEEFMILEGTQPEVQYRVPTNYSFVVPAHYIRQLINLAKDWKVPDDAISPTECVKRATRVVRSRDDLRFRQMKRTLW